jgi:hypothetical protein
VAGGLSEQRAAAPPPPPSASKQMPAGLDQPARGSGCSGRRPASGVSRSCDPILVMHFVYFTSLLCYWIATTGMQGVCSNFLAPSAEPHRVHGTKACMHLVAAACTCTIHSPNPSTTRHFHHHSGLPLYTNGHAIMASTPPRLAFRAPEIVHANPEAYHRMIGAPAARSIRLGVLSCPVLSPPPSRTYIRDSRAKPQPIGRGAHHSKPARGEMGHHYPLSPTRITHRRCQHTRRRLSPRKERRVHLSPPAPPPPTPTHMHTNAAELERIPAEGPR